MRKLYTGKVDAIVLIKGFTHFIKFKENILGTEFIGFIPLSVMDGRKVHLTKVVYNEVKNLYEGGNLEALKGLDFTVVYSKKQS